MTDITDILELAILLILTIVTRYAVPLIRAKLEASKFSNLLTWADIFVRAAEQMFIGEKLGKDKLNKAMAMLKDFCEKYHYTFSEDEIRAAIEQAVNNMNNSEPVLIENGGEE